MSAERIEAVAWHALPVGAVAERLRSDAVNGIGTAEAARRLAEYGPNEVLEEKRRSPLALLLAQFRDFMILVPICPMPVVSLMLPLVDIPREMKGSCL